jgi:hypothetical protein
MHASDRKTPHPGLEPAIHEPELLLAFFCVFESGIRSGNLMLKNEGGEWYRFALVSTFWIEEA